MIRAAEGEAREYRAMKRVDLTSPEMGDRGPGSTGAWAVGMGSFSGTDPSCCVVDGIGERREVKVDGDVKVA